MSHITHQNKCIFHVNLKPLTWSWWWWWGGGGPTLVLVVGGSSVNKCEYILQEDV